MTMGNGGVNRSINYICHICSEQFDYTFFLEGHLKDVHDATQWICLQCDRNSTTKTTLQLHIDVAHCGSDEMYICEVKDCGKAFNAEIHLERHRKREHSEEFRCEHCGKLCSQRYLPIHLQICRDAPGGRKVVFGVPAPGVRVYEPHEAHLASETDIVRCSYDGCEKAFLRGDLIHSHQPTCRYRYTPEEVATELRCLVFPGCSWRGSVMVRATQGIHHKKGHRRCRKCKAVLAWPGEALQ